MSGAPTVDLRSDTAARPTPEMRQAIARAEVGDDVFGDDPTVAALERRVAVLAGKEAALYVPSGTMGNQLAVHCQTSPGDRVILEAESHIFNSEQGGVAANSGCLAHVVRSERGAVSPAALESAFEDDPEDDHVARATLLCLENTHNRHGGAVVPLERLRAAAAAARSRGARVHLDGARLWNASVATGIPIRDWAAVPDTVMMCFSRASAPRWARSWSGPRRSSSARAACASAGVAPCARWGSWRRRASTRSTTTWYASPMTTAARAHSRPGCARSRACG